MKRFLLLFIVPLVYCADLQKMVESDFNGSMQQDPSSANLNIYGTAHVANSVVLSWANESIVSTFSYDAANYQQTFQLASNYYTQKGWLELDKRHNEMKDLEQVKKLKLIMSAVAVGPAKIVSQGVVSGTYSWVVEAPYLITAADISHENKRKILVRSLIVRSDPDVHYRGLAIDKIAIKYLLDLPGDQSASTQPVLPGIDKDTAVPAGIL
ncbi:MAG: DotI/IcmL/TraM family protein [Legionellales bacterium]|nr:DotI/IcmL/TraM family protein [Legionellales bacterium]